MECGWQVLKISKSFNSYAVPSPLPSPHSSPSPPHPPPSPHSSPPLLTMLAMSAEADPPPGAAVLAARLSTKERREEETKGPSTPLPIRYLQIHTLLHELGMWTSCNTPQLITRHRLSHSMIFSSGLNSVTALNPSLSTTRRTWVGTNYTICVVV